MRLVVQNNEHSGVSRSKIREWSAATDEYSEVIYRGRNLIRLIKEPNRAAAVKIFSKSLKNKLIYAIRKSKAKKSFDNALVLINRGIGTPVPYGYIEKRGMFNILLMSEYLCEYDDRLSLHDAIKKRGRECLAAFAEFVAELHRKGIRHDDLNDSNVRVSVCENRFSFSLIDLNRMKIYGPNKAVPEKECFRNLCRFCELDNEYIYFVKKYIAAGNLPASSFATIMDIKRKHDKGVERKRQFKKFFKNIAK